MRGSLGELESLCEWRGFTQRLSSSPKLPRVFASGYVNTASVLYFFYKMYDKDSATETTTVPFYLNIKVKIHNTRACLRVNIHKKSLLQSTISINLRKFEWKKLVRTPRNKI